MHLEFNLISQNPDYVKVCCKVDNPLNYACRRVIFNY